MGDHQGGLQQTTFASLLPGMPHGGVGTFLFLLPYTVKVSAESALLHQALALCSLCSSPWDLHEKAIEVNGCSLAFLPSEHAPWHPSCSLEQCHQLCFVPEGMQPEISSFRKSLSNGQTLSCNKEGKPKVLVHCTAVNLLGIPSVRIFPLERHSQND